jgi:hypothetical protein
MQRRLRTCIELPPRQARGADSSIKTEAPASRAISAAHNAALPPPITRTSGIAADDTLSSSHGQFTSLIGLRKMEHQAFPLRGSPAGQPIAPMEMARCSRIVELSAAEIAK